MGYLIAFDGIDAPGKTTQAKILEKKLRDSGKDKDILYLTFPVYESESSALVRLYLNGGLGKDPAQINPYAASSFYAADRHISYITGWQEFYGREKSIIITDRYTTANAVHQLPKLPKSEWDGFLDWLYDYEFCKLNIPKPNLTVFFDMHPDVALKLIESRAQKTRAQKDIHESAPEYLKKCYEAGRYAAGYLGWETVICCKKDESGALVPETQEKISEILLGLVEKYYV